MRINRLQYYLEVAQLTARRSTCQRRKVGAVLVKNNRIIMTGYNGAPQGEPHCLSCDLSRPCGQSIHAEDNLFRSCEKLNINTKNTIVYLTLSPCVNCLNLCIQNGVQEIYFTDKYRVSEHLSEYGQKEKIKIYQVTPEYARIPLR